ncbi:MAG: hypothetical protein LBC94_05560 [Desulfovibrio sp.]|nr:hypothetical protein [Desulfovibrio sp.]
MTKLLEKRSARKYIVTAPPKNFRIENAPAAAKANTRRQEASTVHSRCSRPKRVWPKGTMHAKSQQ